MHNHYALGEVGTSSSDIAELKHAVEDLQTAATGFQQDVIEDIDAAEDTSELQGGEKTVVTVDAVRARLDQIAKKEAAAKKKEDTDKRTVADIRAEISNCETQLRVSQAFRNGLLKQGFLDKHQTSKKVAVESKIRETQAKISSLELKLALKEALWKEYKLNVWTPRLEGPGVKLPPIKPAQVIVQHETRGRLHGRRDTLQMMDRMVHRGGSEIQIHEQTAMERNQEAEQRRQKLTIYNRIHNGKLVRKDQVKVPGSETYQTKYQETHKHRCWCHSWWWCLFWPVYMLLICLGKFCGCINCCCVGSSWCAPPPPIDPWGAPADFGGANANVDDDDYEYSDEDESDGPPGSNYPGPARSKKPGGEVW